MSVDVEGDLDGRVPHLVADVLWALTLRDELPPAREEAAAKFQRAMLAGRPKPFGSSLGGSPLPRLGTGETIQARQPRTMRLPAEGTTSRQLSGSAAARHDHPLHHTQ